MFIRTILWCFLYGARWQTTFARSTLGAQTTDAGSNSSSAKSMLQPAGYNATRRAVLVTVASVRPLDPSSRRAGTRELLLLSAWSAVCDRCNRHSSVLAQQCCAAAVLSCCYRHRQQQQSRSHMMYQVTWYQVSRAGAKNRSCEYNHVCTRYHIHVQKVKHGTRYQVHQACFQTFVLDREHSHRGNTTIWQKSRRRQPRHSNIEHCDRTLLLRT